MRKRLSEIVEFEHYQTDPNETLNFIGVLYREKSLFFEDSGIKNDVLYENLRKRISEACSYFVAHSSNLTPWQIHSVAGVFIDIDPEGFLKCLNAEIAQLNDDMFCRVVVEMLRSQTLRKRAYQVVHLIKQARNRSAKDVVSIWESLIWRPVETSKTFELYRKAVIRFRDSSPAPTLVDALSRCERERDDLVLQYWGSLFIAVQRDVIPVLQQLAECNIATDICLELSAKHMEIVGLLNKCEELIAVMKDKDRKAGEHEQARAGFFNGVSVLRRILVEDDPGMVCQLLKSLRSNLNRVVQSYIDKVKNDLDEKAIQLEYNCLDDSTWVFGSRADLYVIVSNLVDNSIRRGHVGSNGLLPRLIRISIEHETANIISLSVADNGIGLQEGWQFGIGLNAVSSVCSRLSAGWTPPSPASEPFVTSVKVKFYEVNAHERE